jgi:hypothetical protein
MIVGRLSICEHKLLRFDAERSQTGSETLIRRQTQPPLMGEAPPIAPAISGEAGLKGLAIRIQKRELQTGTDPWTVPSSSPG